MYLKTHLAIALFFTMLFLNSIDNKLIFVAVLFIATALPDIDSASSFLGKKVKFVAFLSKHRGFFHSLTIAVLFGIILVFLLPSAAFPFFFGYSLHLLTDAFTIQGVQAFWPSPHVSKWKIKTGGITETLIFFSFIILTLLVIFI